MADKNNKNDRKNSDKSGTRKIGLFQLGNWSSNNSSVLKSNTESNIIDVFSEFYSQTGDLSIIQPPFEPLSLLQVVEHSDTLGQCIDAMAINIDGFGWTLEQAPHIDKSKEISPDAKMEKARINRLFKYCNPDIDFVELRKRLRKDLEGCGFAYMEVVRDNKGDIAELYQLPAFSVRITEQDKVATDYEESIRDEEGKFVKVSRKKKFRRIVQLVNQETIYFKEFGDPRDIDKTTGKEGDGTATEVIVFKLYCPYSIYGIPRWIGNLIGIMGSRKAEEINYLFFDNKSIPPLIVTVSGGSLTSESLEKLTHLFKNEIKGLENFHNGLLLEALPQDVGVIEGEKVAPVKIEVKPLTHFIQEDALFKDYRKDNQLALISAFRFAPIYVGKSSDYNRATAYEAARVSEEQVFHPERRAFDYVINRKLFAAMEINNWDFKSLGGKTTDDSENLKALSQVKEAIPVNVINQTVAEMLNIELPELPEEIRMLPLAMLSMQTGNLMSMEGEPTEKALKYLIKVRERIEEVLEKTNKREGV